MDPLSDVISLLKPNSYTCSGFDVGGDHSVQFPRFEGVKYYALVSDHGRKEIEEDIGMVSREEKVSSKGQAISASIESNDVTVMLDHRLEDRHVGGWQRRVGSQTTRMSTP